MLGYWFNFFICLFGLTYFEARVQYVFKKMYSFDSIINCPNETDHLSVLVRNFTFARDGSKFFVSGWLEVFTPKELLKELEVFILKCPEKATEGSCEYFAHWFTEEACFFMKTFPATNKLMRPEWTSNCILKKGVHQIKNSSLDMDLLAPVFKHSGDTGALWKSRVKLYRNHKHSLAACCDVRLRYANVRIARLNNSIVTIGNIF